MTINYTQQETGLTIINSYVRIGRFTGDKEFTTFDFQVYVNEQSRSQGKNPVKIGSESLPTPTTDILPALYTYLKTLPEFVNAIDC